jgi:protein Mpv17
MASLSIVTRFYQQSFETHPYRTLAFTNGLLNGVGDAVAQISQRFVSYTLLCALGLYSQHTQFDGDLRDKPRPYDPARTFRFFCFGFGLGPFIGRWHLFLENTVPLRVLQGTGKVSLKALSKRVTADQLLMAPAGLIVFMGSMGVMEGRSREQIQQKYTDIFMPALIANWKVWPLAQLINFRYMPLLYRVPFQSTCSVFWTLYLSILNAKEDEKQDMSDALRRTLDSN